MKNENVLDLASYKKYADWEREKISQYAGMVNKGNPVIIDVRKQVDFTKGQMAGALNITIEELNPLNPDLIRIRKPVIVIYQ